jgi:hypothetical protein
VQTYDELEEHLHRGATKGRRQARALWSGLVLVRRRALTVE